ncbi:hypothetical protein RO3G_04313 [Rhizopus delemar RA 99-880]|uniref:Argonaute siRNA chaperone complex subunit Arb1 n=1 Tax=Rhizopus delemar (strain RA 99-880 / ATCC MYA-4621 / FGSC 9543 / NRRL 43880) TaxID=246409 RepID=I1BTS8_RHIO9|nr:hypothetical protein RO3G_04313 [Rhizopus delemar RA 99-880]|eukprot:EIE79608.1 hypothetical protein RO3G_04313 [Rhizopus delemar RA 99-880]
MSRLTEEGREQLLEDYLNSQEIADDNEELDSLEEEALGDEMPSELSTPVSLAQQNKVASEQKKKKKKRKRKTANLPEAGVDLPDDYVEKHQEDILEDPFDPGYPLSQRVEYAIWKYRKNHKFTEERRAIFDNYLKFGGINTGPNMFLGRATGADAREGSDTEVDFQAAKLAIDSVPDELEEGIEVSFSEVAQVYLGNTFIRESRFISMQSFIDAPNLIDAFLRYLELRKVAPEYADDIAKARAICAQAKIELPKCKMLTVDMPGKFNQACSIYFGDIPTIMDTSWMSEATMKTQKMFSSFFEETVGMTREEAKRIVQSQIKDTTNTKLNHTLNWVSIKLTDIPPIPSNADLESFFKVTFTNYENDQDKYDIVFEKKIIDNLILGMTAHATLCKLSNGDWYLEEATRIMPSFFMEDDCLHEEDYDY